jgi:hypothetical protein
LQKYKKFCLLFYGGVFSRLPHDFFLFLFPFLLLLQKKGAKKSGFFADMIAARSVRPPTAAAKVNWTLSRFCTQL